MKVSRTVTYAVQALLQLAEAETDAPVPCRRLATEGKMPERFLLQILRDMVTSGILHSMRGVEGGYRLAKPATEITLEEVFEAVDSPLVASVPPLDRVPDVARARLLETFNRISANARSELRGVTLADLLGSAPRPGSRSAATS